MRERKESLAFDRVADTYDATRGGESRGEAVAASLLPFLPAGRLLDVGVGTGVVAKALFAAGRDVVGVDLSGPMLRHAQARIGPRVAQGDALALPVRDRAVSGAYAVWVLHLVADVGDLLAECARVVAPGGRLLLVPGATRPNAGTDVERLLEQMWVALEPGGRPDEEDRVLELAARVGLRYSDRAQFWIGPRPLSPVDLAERIRARSFSVLWDISEEVWQAEIPSLLEQIRALPDQERPRDAGNQYSVLVFDC